MLGESWWKSTLPERRTYARSCGESVPKRLAVRWHSCPYCGCELHRDHNAALNILKKGGGTAFGEAQPLGGPQNREPHRL
ncbi:zinc ribbon domain-containing protein [Chloroflexus sp.]|uniref:zinc ribbon domain-containing protein n=1 Tax=Chloroflexus sp. TaxID=1904827 RepID=UPI002586A010|nr:zinc ribbon domain-containing protein [Chloroflexus sp.]